MKAYVCLIEARLHFGDSHDLKGKRKLLHSLKTQVRQRFGASVAEVDGAKVFAAIDRTADAAAFAASSDRGAVVEVWGLCANCSGKEAGHAGP